MSTSTPDFTVLGRIFRRPIILVTNGVKFQREGGGVEVALSRIFKRIEVTILSQGIFIRIIGIRVQCVHDSD